MKSFFTRLFSTLRAFAPFVAFSLVVSNFCLSCAAYRSARPQYRYRHFTVTNEIVTVVSNVSGSVLAKDISQNNIAPGFSSPVISRPYSYFVVAGVSMAYLDGFYYRAGDSVSSGIIIRIFPDCILLHDGSRIMNSSLPSTQRKEFPPNDR